MIDHQKATNSPRFVHFDECLGFVDSGFARRSKKDPIARANEVYSQFHGFQLGDVISELVGEEESK